MDDRTLKTRLGWVMFVRVAIALALLGVALLLQARAGVSLQATVTLYWIVGLISILTIAYSLLLMRGMNATALAFIQFVGDLLLETFAVYKTGGIESPFNILYLISIITASMLLSMRGAVIIAAGSGIIFGSLVDLQYFRVLPGLGTGAPLGTEAVYTLFLNILAFFLVGVLSGTLATQVRTAEREREATGTDLASLRSLHDRIVQSLNSGLFTTNLQGRITSWNAAAEAITGWPAHEVVGQPFTAAFPGCTGEQAMLDRTGRAGIRQDVTVRHRDGQARILGMAFSHLHGEPGAITGLIGQFQDITETRAREAAMRQQEQLAMIGELAAGVAHEIRNPLAALSGSMQVLNRDLALTPDHRYLMDIAVTEAKRLNAIITDFLLYARPKPMEARPCDLQALLEETVTLVKTTEEYQEATTVTLDSSAVSVLADQDQLRQVFWNLAKNAIQAMPHGGRLEIRAITRGEIVEVAFEDTGEGIPAEHLDQIFDPFFTTKSQGSGLGLPICQRIVQEHGGRVTVESEAGKGTLVRLTLPLAPTPVKG